MFNRMDEIEKELHVNGLSTILQLHETCQRENVKISPESNNFMLYLTVKQLGPILSQKCVKKLVQQGEIQWDTNEDFEVEAILDHGIGEDDREYYLIKWKGWTHEHNSWEPRNNLGCSDLVTTYQAKVAASQDDEVMFPRKRKITLLCADHQQPNKRQKINELMGRIFKSPDKITPMTILSQSPVKHAHNRYTQGLTTKGFPRSAMKRVFEKPIHKKNTKRNKILKEEIHSAIKKWGKQINSINSDPAPIVVENNVDLEGPPSHFQYINDYKACEGVNIPQDPIVGCECTDCVQQKKMCCGPRAGAQTAYRSNRRLRVPPGTPIYECNKRCKCGTECPNRVVQRGRRHRVCIFRTKNGRGWGVKTLQRIPQGSFVMEYVGEVITHEEAERRGKIYDAEGRTYLFDLDYNDGDCPFTVDAGFFGNVSHFVNHCCDPNLVVYGVWIDHLDPRLPRIALFAKCDIAAGEELTFDYMMTGDTTQQSFSNQVKSLAAGDMESCSPSETASIANNEAAPSDVTASDLDVNPGNVDLAAIGEELTSQEAVAEVTEVVEDLDKEEGAKFDFLVPDIPEDIGRVPHAEVVGAKMNVKGVPSSELLGLADAVDDKEDSESGISSMGSVSSIQQNCVVSPSPAMKYRIRCQCGAKNCREFLF